MKTHHVTPSPATVALAGEFASHPVHGKWHYHWRGFTYWAKDGKLTLTYTGPEGETVLGSYPTGAQADHAVMQFYGEAL